MSRFRHPLRDMMIVAMAGPLSNILLATGFTLLMNLVPTIGAADPKLAENVLLLLGQMLMINVLLACFNMIPIPPLDGSRLLAFLLPRRLGELVYTYQAQQFGMLLVVVLAFSGATVFIVPIMQRIAGGILHIFVFV
jgi:Zn-dependent protease